MDKIHYFECSIAIHKNRMGFGHSFKNGIFSWIIKFSHFFKKRIFSFFRECYIHYFENFFSYFSRMIFSFYINLIDYNYFFLDTKILRKVNLFLKILFFGAQFG